MGTHWLGEDFLSPLPERVHGQRPPVPRRPFDYRVTDLEVAATLPGKRPASKPRTLSCQPSAISYRRSLTAHSSQLVAHGSFAATTHPGPPALALASAEWAAANSLPVLGTVSGIDATPNEQLNLCCLPKSRTDSLTVLPRRFATPSASVKQVSGRNSANSSRSTHAGTSSARSDFAKRVATCLRATFFSVTSAVARTSSASWSIAAHIKEPCSPT